MKKYLFLLPLFFLISCNYHKDAAPTQRYLSQQHRVELASYPVDYRYETRDSMPGGNVAIHDSIYKMSMTWPQAWHANKGMTDFWFVALLVASGVCVFLMYKSSANQKEADGKGYLVWLIPIFSCLIIGFSIVDWFHTYEKEIKKIDYVHRMATDGNLETWWPLPAEKY